MTEKLHAALNRLAKWRTVFAGWQLGTKVRGDSESDAVRDHREATIILRAEVSAIAKTISETDPTFLGRLECNFEKEADLLSLAYEARFPRFRATNHGIEMDTRAAETTKGWRP